MALWQNGGYFDGGGRRGAGRGGAVLGFLQQQRKGDTHSHTHGHTYTHCCTEMKQRKISSGFTLSLFHEHHLGVVLEVVSIEEHPLPSGGGTRLQALLIHQRQLLG